MPRNPLEDAGRALRVLGDRLRESAGPEGEWLAGQLERLQPERVRQVGDVKTLDEL